MHNRTWCNADKCTRSFAQMQHMLLHAARTQTQTYKRAHTQSNSRRVAVRTRRDSIDLRTDGKMMETLWHIVTDALPCLALMGSRFFSSFGGYKSHV